MRIRALIIDDEPPARERIRHLLHHHPEIMVIGECRDGLEALNAIELNSPDLLFLDIQMPQLNGFELLAQLSVDTKPYVIFTTAYDQYALQAFEHHAMDYLLKPIDQQRFELAIKKIHTIIKGQNADGFSQKLKSLLGDYERNNSSSGKTFVIKDKGVRQVVRTDEIYWIEAEGNYVNMHCSDAAYLYRCAMVEMERALANRHYLRIHRSLLINTAHLEKTHYLNNETYQFTFKNQCCLVSGRSHKKNIQAFLLWANHIKQH